MSEAVRIFLICAGLTYLPALLFSGNCLPEYWEARETLLCFIPVVNIFYGAACWNRRRKAFALRLKLERLSETGDLDADSEQALRELRMLYDRKAFDGYRERCEDSETARSLRASLKKWL